MDTDKNSTNILLSSLVVDGLRHLGRIWSQEMSRSLIEYCMAKLLQPEATTSSVPELYKINAVKAKQSEYAIVTLYALVTKHCLDSLSLKNLLIEANVDSTVIDELVRVFDERSHDLILRNIRLGSYFPHVNDVKWRILTDVRSSLSDKNSPELIFIVNMGDYQQIHGERHTVTEFVCNTEELQLLINKFREIERHCTKFSKE